MQICDLHRDDAPADGALVIMLDGKRYQLDLCEEHLGTVRGTLQPLLVAAHAARPATGSRQVQGSRRSRAAERSALREWARDNGYEVHDRGRVPRAAVDAYAARGGKADQPAAKVRRRAS